MALLPAVGAHGTVGDEVHVLRQEDGDLAFEPFEKTMSVDLPMAFTDDAGLGHQVVSVVSPRDETPTGRINATVAPRTSAIVGVGPVGDVFYRCSIHGMTGVLHVIAPTPGQTAGLVAISLLLTAASLPRRHGR